MTNIPEMPAPGKAVKDMTDSELRKEVAELRLYTASLYMTLKDYVQNQRLPEGWETRIATIEGAVSDLSARVSSAVGILEKHAASPHVDSQRVDAHSDLLARSASHFNDVNRKISVLARATGVNFDEKES